MTDKDTAQVTETYRLMIDDNVKEIDRVKDLDAVLAYTQLILNFQRKKESSP